MNLHLFLQTQIESHLTKLGIVLFLLVPISFLLIGLLLYIIQMNKKKYRLLQMSHANEILKARVETQEQTFRNISADIHDNIGQQLALANIRTQSLFEAGVDTGDIGNIIRNSMSDLRDLSYSLSAHTITEGGLPTAIRQEFALLNKGNRIKAHFKELGEPAEIDSDTATILYRVFQAAVQNVLKHAQAKLVSAYLCKEGEELQLTIVDDGIGLAPGIVEGQGFANMRSRLKLINGSLTIEDAKPGTLLFIQIPLNR